MRADRRGGEPGAGRRSELVYVDEVAPSAVLTVNWLARPVPLHATSTGKAWLAWLPEPEAKGVLGPALQGFTDATVTDVGRLLAEFGRIRERQGYAMSAGELEPALFGVSAPVLAAGRDPVAVFSIWGPPAGCRASAQGAWRGRDRGGGDPCRRRCAAMAGRPRARA